MRVGREGGKVDDLKDIAKRLRRDISSVCRIERGESQVPADELPALLRAYRLTADQFAHKARERGAA